MGKGPTTTVMATTIGPLHFWILTRTQHFFVESLQDKTWNLYLAVLSKVKLQNIEHNHHNHEATALGIHFVKCVSRVGDRIIGIKTETTTPLGGTAIFYFTAERVYTKQT